MYRDLLFKVDRDYRPYCSEQFTDIAKDELEDHYAKLIEYAESHGYNYPIGYKELSKHVNDKTIKMFESIKKGEDPMTYVRMALESEVDAVKSYSEALQIIEPVDYNSDLKVILMNNYYDENEHFETLKFLEESLALEFSNDEEEE